MSTDSSFDDTDRFESFDTDAQKSPETLEREIDAQRNSIGNIVDALESKFSPGQLIDQVLAYTKGNGGEFFTNLGNTIKANPVPTVLTSVGLLWLMMGQNRKPAYGEPSMFDHMGERLADAAESVTDTFGNAKARLQETTNKMKEKASHVADKASHLTDQVGDKVSSAGHKVNMGSHDASDTVRQQARNLQSGFSYMLREQPLALAAIGIALGAAIGAALPATERENRLMGQASDKLTDKAKHLASEGYDKATEMGKDLVNGTTSSASGPGHNSGNQNGHQPQSPVDLPSGGMN